MGESIKDTIDVTIEYDDGHEDESGQPRFVAFNDDLNFTTEADTFEELLAHLREVLTLCLKETDSVAEYGVAPDAKVRLIMDWPETYAQTA